MLWRAGRGFVVRDLPSAVEKLRIICQTSGCVAATQNEAWRKNCPASSLKPRMDGLTLFGLIAVTAMLVCYALEDRSRWFILGFAVACASGSIYGFLQGAWPFGLVEAIWSLVAARRWWLRKS